MSLLDIVTGGKSGQASDAEQKALQALMAVQTPTAEQLTLPELQQYAVSQNMTPAQTQAFIQQYNALANENVNQQGTAAQQAALAQLGQVANAGAAGTPVEQAQIAQALQQSNQNLQGQRGAIDQAAQARGVAPGLLQAALAQQNAGQDAQNANQAALQAQSQAYQTALNAMTEQAGVGQALQGQQNTQANTIAQTQNAMQQFNAANQQQAANVNAGYKQAANAYNTGMANQTGQANTGLANQRTQYNAQVPQTVYNDAMQKAQAEAGQYGNIANTATGQGQQNAGIMAGLLGASSQLGAGLLGSAGQAGASGASGGFGAGPGAGVNTSQYAPASMMLAASGGGMVPGYACGGMQMKQGGQVPGHAQVPGDSPSNDTVHAKLSPGEVVIPRSMVQSHPEDIAALLQAMKHLRGANNAAH
jgi:hypothetical protein